MTVRQLAEHFSCSPAAIVQAKKKLKAGVVRQAALVSHQIVSRHGDVVSRLQRSLDGFERDLDDSLDLFEQATTIQDKAMALRARTDIRDKVGKQVSRIVETLRFMGDWQLMTTFISEVLTTIERVRPDEQKRILRALEQSCGSSVTAFIRPSDPVPGEFSAERADAPQGACAPISEPEGSD